MVKMTQKHSILPLFRGILTCQSFMIGDFSVFYPKLSVFRPKRFGRGHKCFGQITIFSVVGPKRLVTVTWGDCHSKPIGNFQMFNIIEMF